MRVEISWNLFGTVFMCYHLFKIEIIFKFEVVLNLNCKLKLNTHQAHIKLKTAVGEPLSLDWLLGILGDSFGTTFMD